MHDGDLYLNGRGLTLQPSAFWAAHPLYADHPDGSLLIVYPSATPVPLLGDQSDGDPLAALLGETRARVLAAARAGRTTSELARDLGISCASASEHAKVLRAAGLIATTRAGRAVRHSVTPLGEAILSGG